jgi:hypothetical protein
MIILCILQNIYYLKKIKKLISPNNRVRYSYSFIFKRFFTISYIIIHNIIVITIY